MEDVIAVYVFGSFIFIDKRLVGYNINMMIMMAKSKAKLTGCFSFASRPILSSSVFPCIGCHLGSRASSNLVELCSLIAQPSASSLQWRISLHRRFGPTGWSSLNSPVIFQVAFEHSAAPPLVTSP